MSYLTFSDGVLWVRATAPTGDPATSDIVPNVSEFSVSISPDTTQKGPYLNDPTANRPTIVTGITREGSFSVDVPKAASSVLDLIRTTANDPNGTCWIRFRVGAAADGGSTIYTFTNSKITSFEEAGSGDGITIAVSFTGDLTITTNVPNP